MPAGERHIGEVGKALTIAAFSLTASTTAYGALDCVNTGVLTFAGAARVAGGKGVVRSALFQSRGDVEAPVSLILFSTSAISATLTDNDALVIDDNSLDKIVGVITAATGDYRDLNTAQAAFVAKDVYFDLPAGATSLYGVVQADGAFTYTSFNDLGISITVEQF